MTTNAMDEINKTLRYLENQKLDCLTDFSVQDFWNFVETRAAAQPAPSAPQTHSEDEIRKQIEECFMAYFEKRNFLYFAVLSQLIYELSNATKDTMFRTKSMGLSMLSTLWFKREGKVLLDQLKEPLRKIGMSEETLEINPEKDNSRSLVKKNMKTLLETAQQVLEITMDDKCYSDDMKGVFRGLDKVASVRFSAGYSLVGGVLFLRLINPAIMFPDKYGIIPASNLTSHGRTALVYLGKILQLLANSSEFVNEPYLSPANRFIRRNSARWLSFFHRLFTVAELASSSVSLISSPTAEDLIAKSNHDIYRQLVCPRHLSKQKELILHLMQLEKQTEGWKQRDYGNYSTFIQKVENSSQFIGRFTTEVYSSLQEVFDYFKTSFDQDLDAADAPPNLVESNLIEQWNENICVKQTVYKAGFPFNHREFVFLSFNEILLEDNFAMMAMISIDRDDVPTNPDYVRGEIEGGYILRAGSKKGTISITHIMHVDAKGWAKNAPFHFLKNNLKKMMQKEVAQIHAKFSPSTEAQ